MPLISPGQLAHGSDGVARSAPTDLEAATPAAVNVDDANMPGSTFRSAKVSLARIGEAVPGLGPSGRGALGRSGEPTQRTARPLWPFGRFRDDSHGMATGGVQVKDLIAAYGSRKGVTND